MVNILEVPIEIMEFPKRVCSASSDAPSTMPPRMTFNPEDRYKKIHSQPPTKLPRYYCSTDALREKVEDNYAHQIGGPVQVVSRMEDSILPPVRTMRRLRDKDRPQWHFGSYHARATPASIETMPDSVPSKVEESPLAEMQPFAPLNENSSELRPATRTGLLSSSLFGLGITNFGSTLMTGQEIREEMMSDQKDIDTEVSDYVLQCPPAPRIPSIETFGNDFFQPRRAMPSGLPMRENNWSSVHPNPLRGNPTPPLDLHTSTFGAFTSANVTSNSVSYAVSPVATPSSPPEYHPGFIPNTSSPVSGSEADLFDMRSPTYTADTVSSAGAGLSTPDRFQSSEQFYNSIGNTSPGQNNKSQHDRVGELSNRLSRLTSSNDSIYEYENHETIDNPHGRNLERKAMYNDLNSSSVTLKPLPTPQKSVRPQNEYTAFEQADMAGPVQSFSLSAPISAESPVKDMGGDFASSVFGALGLAL